jgi:hypothetical protein
MTVNYNGSLEEAMKATKLVIFDELNENPVKTPIVFKTVRPAGEDGTERDQRPDAVNHMRYAHTLGLPELQQRPLPRYGRAIIVGGAPSIQSELDNIRELSKDPNNAIFAINWSHTWLLQNGIIPHYCVFFEIDAEPDTVLKNAHPDVNYYICSHCHERTFDMLKDYKRVLWHSIPNSPDEHECHNELFPESSMVGGGIGTFTRTLSIALFLGFRNLDLFGCDSSFPDDGITHADGYETPVTASKDGFYVYARHDVTGNVRRFRTLGYLALQVEEFKEYCLCNHQIFTCRVHGDSLLRFTHESTYPDQYAVNGL